MTVTDCDGTVLESGLTIGSGSFEAVDVCVPSASIIITVDGGSWQSEVGWSLLDPSGNVVTTGGAGTTNSC